MIHKINELVIGRYPKDILRLIQPSINGPWIAGGSALALFNGEQIETDIDIFCDGMPQYEQTLARVRNWDRSEWPTVDTHTSENAVTVTLAEKYGSEKRYKLQVIKKKFSPTFKDLLNDFDLTVCQIGTTDGSNWYATEQCLLDIASQTLRVRKVDTDTVKRAVKYWSRGYEPCSDSWDFLIKEGTWEFETGNYDGNY